MGINSKLYRWGIKNSNACDLCGEYEETYVHLFCSCTKVKSFWIDVKRWITSETDTALNLSDSDIILGTMLKMPPIFDLFIIVAKMHIYACKFHNTIPKVEGFIKRIENI